jgi:hypothetical protein
MSKAPELPSVETLAELPSFKPLNERQRKFVWALLKWGSGKGNRTKCAREAGYQGNDDVLGITAVRLFHDPRIQQALHEVAAARLGSFQLFAIENLTVLAETADKEEVRLKATGMILDRTGFNAVQEHKVTHHNETEDREQRLAEMTALCARNPKLLDTIAVPALRALIEQRIAQQSAPQPLPVKQLPVIDAQYKEVPPEDPDDKLLGVG